MESQEVTPETGNWTRRLVNSVCASDNHPSSVGIPPDACMLAASLDLIESVNDIVDTVRILDLLQTVCRFRCDLNSQDQSSSSKTALGRRKEFRLDIPADLEYWRARERQDEHKRLDILADNRICHS